MQDEKRRSTHSFEEPLDLIQQSCTPALAFLRTTSRHVFYSLPNHNGDLILAFEHCSWVHHYAMSSSEDQRTRLFVDFVPPERIALTTERRNYGISYQRKSDTLLPLHFPEPNLPWMLHRIDDTIARCSKLCTRRTTYTSETSFRFLRSVKALTSTSAPLFKAFSWFCTVSTTLPHFRN